jgi:hypothetical protein
MSSQDLHALLESLADSKLKAKGLARGIEGSSHERNVILAGFRRELSMASAKAYPACLLTRVARVGGGAQAGCQKKSMAE